MGFKFSLPCGLSSTLNRRPRRSSPFALHGNVWHLLSFILLLCFGLGKPEDAEGQTFVQLKNTALKTWARDENQAIATMRKAIAKCTFNECVLLGEELGERWESSLKSVAMELTVEAYERALAVMPHPEVSRRLGNVFLKLQRHNDSIPHFRAAINTGQKFAYINLHNMMLYNSDLSAQLEVAKYMASIASKYAGPNLVRERTQYAYWLLIQGEFTKALMQLDFADKYLGKIPEFKFMGALLRCYCHLGLGDQDTASTWQQHLEQMMTTDLATVIDAMSWHNYYHFLPWYHIGGKVQQQMHMDRLQAGSRAPPMLADHFLPGFRVPEQLEELYQYDEQRLVEEGEAWWILKLMGGANAKGIRVETDLSRSRLEGETGLLVQQYVQSPFLLNGHKFKMRTYVVVMSALPLRAYLFDDGFLYLSTKAYDRDKAHVNDSEIHISGTPACPAAAPLPVVRGRSEWHCAYCSRGAEHTALGHVFPSFASSQQSELPGSLQQPLMQSPRRLPDGTRASFTKKEARPAASMPSSRRAQQQACPAAGMPSSRHAQQQACPAAGAPSSKHAQQQACPAAGMPSSRHAQQQACPAAGMPSSRHAQQQACPGAGMPRSRRAQQQACPAAGMPGSRHAQQQACPGAGMPRSRRAQQQACPAAGAPSSRHAQQQACPAAGMPSSKHAQQQACPAASMPSSKHAQQQACPAAGMPSSRHAQQQACLAASMPSSRHAQQQACPAASMPSSRRAQQQACPAAGAPSSKHAQQQACPAAGVPSSKHAQQQACPAASMPSSRRAQQQACPAAGMPSSRHAQQQACPAASMPSSRHAQQQARPAAGMPSSRHAQQQACPAASMPSSRHAQQQACPAAGAPSSRRAQQQACPAASAPSSKHARQQACPAASMPSSRHAQQQACPAAGAPSSRHAQQQACPAAGMPSSKHAQQQACPAAGMPSSRRAQQQACPAASMPSSKHAQQQACPAAGAPSSRRAQQQACPGAGMPSSRRAHERWGVPGGQAKDFDAFPPMPIREFRRMLREELHYSDEDIQRMWRGIQRLSAGSLLSVQDVLAEHMRQMYPEKQRDFTLPHILSFDVQLDSNLQPWFIEVNPGGGLRTASSIKAPVLQELLHETWRMTIRRHHARMPNATPEVERRGSTAWVAHQLTEHGCKVADACAPSDDRGCCFNTSEIADIAMAISEDTHRGVFQRLLPTFSTVEMKHIGIEDSAFPSWMANSLLGIKLAAFGHTRANGGGKRGGHEEL
ncbi:hypothetical protein CYMTET_38450 [Cymbomonas tetramitiformis]|uniref:Uncharacterized protein n=1 Tax=Cymbomonas tetramitiformis TaxID=36881 RepID=A0AAE0CDS6_9CHLO|nr:hypothetical protein CYMTET_38450 [Cymbomonas tetramitiformis]